MSSKEKKKRCRNWLLELRWSWLIQQSWKKKQEIHDKEGIKIVKKNIAFREGKQERGRKSGT